MRLESGNESLARVVNARGETLGIVTTKRLREPLLDEGQTAGPSSGSSGDSPATG